MINISLIKDMPADLAEILESKGQRLSAFDYYGVVVTSANRLHLEAQIIAEKLADATVIMIPLPAGLWQPGALCYNIYLIK